MGCGKVPKGYLQIGSGFIFSEKTGYGIDLGSKAKIIDCGGQDPIKHSFMTSDKPFFFSVNLPEGNYKVTLTIGNSKEAGELTVKAESRRLVLKKMLQMRANLLPKHLL